MHLSALAKKAAGILIVFCSVYAHAQDVPIENQKFILFPHPLNHKWIVSVGVTATTMPTDITEELRFRIPAAELHVLKKISNKFSLDARLSAQVIQNLISIGPRWTTKFSDRVSMALGNDVAFWFGRVNIGGLKTRGTGWQNYPNISFGYRFNKQILLTVKAESIMNLNVKTSAGETEVETDYKLFSGSAYTIALEQPFFHKKSLTLGFRAIYSNYYWQTWTLFESFDRNLFFPQVIIGVIL
ncbi:MAG: hypothetical protein V4676_01225 [Bacteroidota bacterium]